jgi:heterodisulfide reductase subunit C
VSATRKAEFRSAVEARTGLNYDTCYQCGKCSAGCPAAYGMDLLPHQIMRLLQMSRKDKVLNSRTIWMCASCETCTTRCPKEVDIARTMDALREIAYAEGRVQAQEDTVVFSEEFLNWVRRTGRQFESGLVGMYKLRTGHFLQDLDAAPKMMGKLKIFPRRIKGHAAVARIFEKCKEKK